MTVHLSVSAVLYHKKLPGQIFQQSRIVLLGEIDCHETRVPSASFKCICLSKTDPKSEKFSFEDK